MNKAFAIGLAVVAALTLTWATAPAQGKRSDTVVKTTARVDKNSPPGKAVIVVSLDIKPGWHLYANPVGNEDIEGSQVVVKVADAKAQIEYPAGKEVTDKTLGKYKIYEDRIEIRAIVDRTATTTNPIELSVRVQACDDKNCLPPATVKLSVP